MIGSSTKMTRSAKIARPRTSVAGSLHTRRRRFAPASPKALSREGAGRSALRSNLVFPLLGQSRAVGDGELPVVLDELGRGERRNPLRWRDIVADGIGVSEVGLDRLRLLAQQEVDEFLGALRIGAAL